MQRKPPQPERSLRRHEAACTPVKTEVIFLRLPDVKAITGLSKTSLYGLIKEQSFPTPVRLSSRTVAWVRSEVMEWALSRIKASRPPEGEPTLQVPFAPVSRARVRNFA